MPLQPENANQPPEDGGGLLAGELVVLNVGLDLFAEELRSLDVPVVEVEWTPPGGGDPELAELLSRLGA